MFSDEYKQKYCEQQDELYRLRTQVAQFTELLDDNYTNWGWQHSWTTERQMEFDTLKRRPGWESNTFRDYEIHWNTHHKVFYRVASADIEIVERQKAVEMLKELVGFALVAATSSVLLSLCFVLAWWIA